MATEPCTSTQSTVIRRDADDVHAKWVPRDRAIRIEVRLTEEPTGGYSVGIPDLPGVCSQGETIEEAMQNISEAFCGAAEAYLEGGGSIPWLSVVPEADPDEIQQWLVVHV